MGSTAILQRLEVGQLDLGPDVDLGGEDQFLAVLDLGDLDVGLAERAHLGGRDGLAVAAGQRVVDDLLEHRAAADAGLEKLGRRLAGAEAGQADLLGQLLVGPVEVGLQLGEGHLHVDANPGRAQLLDGALHGCAPRVVLVDGLGRLRVGVTGFEPAAFRSQSGCATKLRYTPSVPPRSYGSPQILRPDARRGSQLDLIWSAPVQSGCAAHAGVAQW